MRPKQLAILFISLATLLTYLIVAQGAEASDDYEPLLLKARTLLPENIPHEAGGEDDFNCNPDQQRNREARR